MPRNGIPACFRMLLCEPDTRYCKPMALEVVAGPGLRSMIRGSKPSCRQRQASAKPVGPAPKIKMDFA